MKRMPEQGARSSIRVSELKYCLALGKRRSYRPSHRKGRLCPDKDLSQQLNTLRFASCSIVLDELLLASFQITRAQSSDVLTPQYGSESALACEAFKTVSFAISKHLAAYLTAPARSAHEKPVLLPQRQS